jgi:hypothetical protein
MESYSRPSNVEMAPNSNFTLNFTSPLSYQIEFIVGDTPSNKSHILPVAGSDNCFVIHNYSPNVTYVVTAYIARVRLYDAETKTLHFQNVSILMARVHTEEFDVARSVDHIISAPRFIRLSTTSTTPKPNPLICYGYGCGQSDTESNYRVPYVYFYPSRKQDGKGWIKLHNKVFSLKKRTRGIQILKAQSKEMSINVDEHVIIDLSKSVLVFASAHIFGKEYLDVRLNNNGSRVFEEAQLNNKKRLCIQ